VDDTRRFNDLRAHYRAQWDAYQVIAQRNLEIVNAGNLPSTDQLKAEQSAAAAVGLARDQLLAAISRLGH
jgi:hypothetical protein